MNTPDPIFPDLKSAREAMERGECVRIQVDPFPLRPDLLQLALDLRTRDRLRVWKQDQDPQNHSCSNPALPAELPTEGPHMTTQDYITEVLRTYAGSEDTREKLCLAALGVTGEAGEVADSVKKALFQGHDIDPLHLAKELGDILWYIVLACTAIGYSLDEVMLLNVQKLRARYPDGFDAERSIHREQEHTTKEQQGEGA